MAEWSKRDQTGAAHSGLCSDLAGSAGLRQRPGCGHGLPIGHQIDGRIRDAPCRNRPGPAHTVKAADTPQRPISYDPRINRSVSDDELLHIEEVPRAYEAHDPSDDRRDRRSAWKVVSYTSIQRRALRGKG